MKEELRKLIKDLLDLEVVDDNASLGIDSIDFLDLILRIETVYSIHINAYSIDKNISLDALNNIVENIVADKTKIN